MVITLTSSDRDVFIGTDVKLIVALTGRNICRPQRDNIKMVRGAGTRDMNFVGKCTVTTFVTDLQIDTSCVGRCVDCCRCICLELRCEIAGDFQERIARDIHRQQRAFSEVRINGVASTGGLNVHRCGIAENVERRAVRIAKRKDEVQTIAVGHALRVADSGCCATARLICDTREVTFKLQSCVIAHASHSQIARKLLAVHADKITLGDGENVEVSCTAQIDD